MDITGALKLVGTLVSLYAAVLWVASVLWVYRDVRARSDDPTTQAIGVALVALIPLFGIAVYLIVRPRETILDAYERELEREALRFELHSVTPCPNCRRPVETDFILCAYCRTPVREACSRCSRLLMTDWPHCPYCGTSKPTRQMAAPAPRATQAPRAMREEAPVPRGEVEDIEVPGVARRRPAVRRADDDFEPDERR